MLCCRGISPWLWWRCQALAMVQISWLVPELLFDGLILWYFGCLECFGLGQQEDCVYPSWCWAEREWWAPFLLLLHPIPHFQQGQLMAAPCFPPCTKPWQRQAVLGFVLYSPWVCPSSEIGLLATMKSSDTNFPHDYGCKIVENLASMSFHFFIFLFQIVQWLFKHLKQLMGAHVFNFAQKERGDSILCIFFISLCLKPVKLWCEVTTNWWTTDICWLVQQWSVICVWDWLFQIQILMVALELYL